MPTFMEYYKKLLFARPRIVLLGYLAIAIVLGVLGISALERFKSEGFDDPTSEAYKTNELFTNEYQNPSPDILVLMSHPTWYVNSTEFRNSYFQFKAALTGIIPSVYGWQSHFDYPLQIDATSYDGHQTYVTARVPTSVTDLSYAKLSPSASNNTLTITFAGGQLVSVAITTAIGTDLANIEQLGLPILIAILILAFEGLGKFIILSQSPP